MNAKIAVFNHSANLLTLFEQNLTSRGYQVFTFEQAMTNFEEIAALAPDVIIIGSIEGFGVDELQFLQQLRAEYQLQDVPIIISTTIFFIDTQIIERIPKLSVLLKPFDIPTLLDCVEQAL
jgi:DNA-binding NtrC family response regulator